MLSLFPDLLSYHVLGDTLIRVVTAVYFLLYATRLARLSRAHNTPKRTRIIEYFISACEGAVGIALFIGVYTQGAALFGVALTATPLFLGTNQDDRTVGQHVRILLCVLCVSLLFLAPGIFAFDKPL